ncbi:hypothetical protein [Paucibacter sp. KCTC 42545]|uniref:hypothetical protein n=1 Tax=Paucibacter sp. KCTC 42545 TaxID=1768242 RepID=UPI0018D25FE8|nr:hypothetical protein [Paucibacter sp. KCTC 42545]
MDTPIVLISPKAQIASKTHMGCFKGGMAAAAQGAAGALLDASGELADVGAGMWADEEAASWPVCGGDCVDVMPPSSQARIVNQLFVD